MGWILGLAARRPRHSTLAPTQAQCGKPHSKSENWKPNRLNRIIDCLRRHSVTPRKSSLSSGSAQPPTPHPATSALCLWVSHSLLISSRTSAPLQSPAGSGKRANPETLTLISSLQSPLSNGSAQRPTPIQAIQPFQRRASLSLSVSSLQSPAATNGDSSVSGFGSHLSLNRVRDS